MHMCSAASAQLANQLPNKATKKNKNKRIVYIKYSRINIALYCIDNNNNEGARARASNKSILWIDTQTHTHSRQAQFSVWRTQQPR